MAGPYEPITQNPQAQAALAKGQAALENAGKKFGGIFRMFFFLSAICVTAGGVIAVVSAIFVFENPLDFVLQTYVIIFGLLMMIIDAPYDNNQRLKDYRLDIYKYARFLTRFVGRGIWYLFQGALIIGLLAENHLAPLAGFFMGGFIFLVACFSLFFGVKLTSKLEQVRKRVVEQGPEQWGAYIPPSGMTKVQFRELAATLKGIVFSDEELTYIVAAFSETVRSDDIISKEEFEEWTKGGMLVL